MAESLHLTEHELVRIVHESPEALVLEAEWGPGGSPPPAHLHPDQDERFVVSADRLRARVAGEERLLEPGDMLEVPRQTVHQVWNDGDEPARATWDTRPAGRTADWLRRLNELNGGGTRQASIDELIEAVQEFGDVFRLA